mgnify:CR=1 FL=1
MYRRKFFFGKHKGEFILDVIESDTVYKNLRKTMSLLSFYFLIQRNTAF